VHGLRLCCCSSNTWIHIHLPLWTVKVFS